MFSIVKLQKCVYALFITFTVITILPAVSFSDEEANEKKCQCWEMETIVAATFTAEAYEAGALDLSVWSGDPCSPVGGTRIVQTLQSNIGRDRLDKQETFKLTSDIMGDVSCQYHHFLSKIHIKSVLHKHLTPEQCKACNKTLEWVYNKFNHE